MPTKAAPVMDLSKIDFEALATRFKESKHKNTDLEVLKGAVPAQLEKLIRLNKTRADFQAKFEELIESYNTGSRNIEDLFKELLKLSRSLSDEQQRHVREHMAEEPGKAQNRALAPRVGMVPSGTPRAIGRIFFRACWTSQCPTEAYTRVSRHLERKAPRLVLLLRLGSP
jgi:hypothetical protein